MRVQFSNRSLHTSFADVITAEGHAERVILPPGATEIRNVAYVEKHPGTIACESLPEATPTTTIALRRATTFERCRNCDSRIAELNHQALDVTLPSGHVLTLCAFCAGDDLMAHARRQAS